MKTERVFITGLSALTACGNTLQTTWESILAGITGIAEITLWDLSTWTHRLGGELKSFTAAKSLPDRKLIKLISRHDAMGINAATQAILNSKLLDYRSTINAKDAFNEGTAIYVGSPGNKYSQQYDFLPLLYKTGLNDESIDMQQFAGSLFNEVHPMWLLRILPNNVLAYTGIVYGFKGPNHNITNHAVSGTQALLEGFNAIKHRQVERAVVVSYDTGIEPQALFNYEKLGVLSSRHLKAFDVEHDGTVFSEGAGALILESETSAKARGAICYAEVAGGFSATEGEGLFSIQPSGSALACLLTRTLRELAISPSQVGVVVAHGNGSPLSDNSEAHAIKTVFGTDVCVTGFKWALGHALCASGILDTVLATNILGMDQIPGIVNFTKPAPDCVDLNISAKSCPLGNNKTALIINRGFASMNACVVLHACEDYL